MTSYRVTRADGTEVRKGDTIHSFRGEPWIFQFVTRGIEYNGTAKVYALQVSEDGEDDWTQEFYAQVFDLTVTTLGEER